MGAEGKGHMSLGTQSSGRRRGDIAEAAHAESNECRLAFTDGVLALVGCSGSIHLLCS